MSCSAIKDQEQPLLDNECSKKPMDDTIDTFPLSHSKEMSGNINPAKSKANIVGVSQKISPKN